MSGRPTPLRLVIVLGLLNAAAPLSTTMYVPAMPGMATDLGAGASALQLTISGLTLGLAAGHLVVGPLSDRFGRKRPLLVALAAYVVACVGCATAPTVEVLVAARVLQGVAGAGGIVVGRAIVRDLHEGAAALRLFALLVAVTSVTPVVSPLLGGQVLLLGSWRDIFLVQGLVGAALALATALVVPETLPPARRRPERPWAVTRAAAALLRGPVILGFSLTCGLVYGAMLTAIAGSSFALQHVYGTSETMTAVLLAAAAATMLVASRLNATLAPRHGAERLLRAGVAATVASGALTLVTVVAGLGVAAFVPAFALSFAAHALTLPNATALVLAERPDALGSASAALGVTQYTFGALAAPLGGLAGGGTAVPMAAEIAVLGLASLAASALALRSRRRRVAA